ncbi:hypothetical protein P3T37_004444 [Kitasatospora sp. MAA4]|nr:hypothetical protein [Kitasatospora sp. MAA4]
MREHIGQVLLWVRHFLTPNSRRNKHRAALPRYGWGQAAGRLADPGLTGSTPDKRPAAGRAQARHRHGCHATPPSAPSRTNSTPPFCCKNNHPVPAHLLVRTMPLRAEENALVRPYYDAEELRLELRLQRERRTAAVLAAMGIDYPNPPPARAWA